MSKKVHTFGGGSHDVPERDRPRIPDACPECSSTDVLRLPPRFGGGAEFKCGTCKHEWTPVRD